MHANSEIVYADRLTIRTRGFFVRREKASIEVQAGSPGRTVFYHSGDLLGMTIASLEH